MILPAYFEEYNDIEKEAWIQGAKEALRAYAWWQDGIEYVGCGLTTLNRAMRQLEDVEFDSEQ